VKHFLLNARALATLLVAVLVYVFSGRTPSRGLQAMIQVHAATNGWATQAIAALFRLGRPARPLDGVRDPKDLFAGLSADQTATVVGGLRRDGYAVAPTRIPGDVVARLRAFAEQTQGTPTDAAGKSGPRQRYDRSDRTVAKFQFDARDLANQVDIQNLAADTGLLDIAQRYLGCLPVLDSIAMWWSTPHLERPADEIAQRFHIDNDRLRWLKIFIYLTDVNQESGPHVFVRHSHLREPRRAELVARGYVRLADEDVRRVYRADEIVDIVGPAGTVLLEDTSGFHKGRMPEKLERLMLEYQFSSNLFGANYEPMRLSGPPCPRLAAAMRALPSAYSMFV
jgi:hypothetical protein